MTRQFTLALLLLAAFPARAADKGDVWIEVRSPNFIVICNTSEKNGRNIAEQFEMFRGVFAQIFPRARVDLGKPLIIFAVKNEKTLKELLPEYWEQKGRTHPAGIFVPGQEKLYVAIRTDASGEYPCSIVYHEYVHALMRLNAEDLPIWLNEGLAEFYAQAYFSNKEVTLGRPSDYHLLNLQQQDLLRLEVLLSVGRDSPYYNEQNKASVFYSQSWALTHFLMFDKAARSGEWLLNYVKKTSAGVKPVDAAEQVFGDLGTFRKRFEAYIRQSVFSAFKTKPKAQIDEQTFSARALTPAESAAQLGDFHVHMDRPVEAKALLEEALKLDPRSPLAHESFGVFHLRKGEWLEAARWFEKAVDLDSKSFLAHFYAAQLVIQRGGMLEEFEKTETRLRRAIALNPAFAPAYSNLATLYAVNDEKLEEALKLALKASQLEPGFLPHRINIAQVLMRMRRVDEAITLADRVLAAATEPAERMLASAFLEGARQYKETMARYEAEKKAAEDRAARRAAQMAEVEAALAKRAEEEAARRAATRLKPGEVVAYGTITQVTCTGPEALQLRLITGNSSIILRAAKKAAVQYFIGQGEPLKFDPCQKLNGQQAEVIYLAGKTRTQLGEIRRIEMLDSPITSGPAPAPGKVTAAMPTASATASASSPAPPPGGRPGWSEGKIASVSCSGTEMRITVDVGGGFSTKLHSANYHKVEFTAAAGITVPNGFQPCTQLRGHKAEVKYFAVDRAAYEGEIASIEIRP